MGVKAFCIAKVALCPDPNRHRLVRRALEPTSAVDMGDIAMADETQTESFCSPEGPASALTRSRLVPRREAQRPVQPSPHGQRRRFGAVDQPAAGPAAAAAHLGGGDGVALHELVVPVEAERVAVAEVLRTAAVHLSMLNERDDDRRERERERERIIYSQLE